MSIKPLRVYAGVCVCVCVLSCVYRVFIQVLIGSENVRHGYWRQKEVGGNGHG